MKLAVRVNRIATRCIVTLPGSLVQGPPASLRLCMLGLDQFQGYGEAFFVEIPHVVTHCLFNTQKLAGLWPVEGPLTNCAGFASSRGESYQI